GDTVNVASRMESAASPNTIKVSGDLYERLKNSGMKFSAPIECNIKGKGAMTTYDILTGENQ
ncbi:MAG: adenylate/guanylate cyclase domain-containing protein, partial [Treponema sp.]|nr:adenylate/guanylate cyclase domain-containing protein [Treponema sp.]